MPNNSTPLTEEELNPKELWNAIKRRHQKEANQKKSIEQEQINTVNDTLKKHTLVTDTINISEKFIRIVEYIDEKVLEKLSKIPALKKIVDFFTFLFDKELFPLIKIIRNVTLMPFKLIAKLGRIAQAFTSSRLDFRIRIMNGVTHALGLITDFISTALNLASKAPTNVLGKIFASGPAAVIGSSLRMIRVSWELGVKIYHYFSGYTPEESLFRTKADRKKTIKELKFLFQQTQADNSISEEKRSRKLVKIYNLIVKEKNQINSDKLYLAKKTYDVVTAAIGLTAAVLCLFPPVAATGALILGGLAIYNFIDSFDFAVIKSIKSKIFSSFKAFRSLDLAKNENDIPEKFREKHRVLPLKRKRMFKRKNIENTPNNSTYSFFEEAGLELTKASEYAIDLEKHEKTWTETDKALEKSKIEQELKSTIKLKNHCMWLTQQQKSNSSVGIEITSEENWRKAKEKPAPTHHDKQATSYYLASTPAAPKAH